MNNTPFKPKAGSFLTRPSVHFVVHPGDKPMVIGRIIRLSRTRYEWARYSKPVLTTSTAKKEPEVIERHRVGNFNTAVWATRLSYENSVKEQPSESVTQPPDNIGTTGETLPPRLPNDEERIRVPEHARSST